MLSVGVALRRAFGWTLVVVVVAVVVSGCGGGGAASGGSTDAGLSTQSAPAIATAGRHRSSSPRPSAGRSGPPPARCGNHKFAVRSVFPSTAAAGTTYTRFEIINLSGHACSTSGYPTIIALGSDGRPIGGPSVADSFLPHTGPRGPRTVTIASGGSASFLVETHSDYSDDTCPLRKVSRDRILLPGSRHAETMPSVEEKACSNGGGVPVGPIE